MPGSTSVYCQLALQFDHGPLAYVNDAAAWAVHINDYAEHRADRDGEKNYGKPMAVARHAKTIAQHQRREQPDERIHIDDALWHVGQERGPAGGVQVKGIVH